jgi:hypothetical protein
VDKVSKTGAGLHRYTKNSISKNGEPEMIYWSVRSINMPPINFSEAGKWRKTVNFGMPFDNFDTNWQYI